jgi:uncharacterized membrane protein
VEALRSPFARIRANPWLAVGIAATALLVAVWLGWAIYVASDRGVNEGLGVLIAVPALVVAVAIVSLPFIGGYLLVRRLSAENDPQETKDAETKDEETADESHDEEEDSESEEEHSDGDEEEQSDGDTDEESGGDSDEESEPEPEAAAG